MSLIVYECQRAGHGHEIRQFSAAAQSLYDYLYVFKLMFTNMA